MSKPHLIYYDTSQIYYASYYLNGFNELKNTHHLQISIANSLPERLKPAVQNPDWQHLLFAMVLFKLQQGNKEWYFCIDTHDDNSLNVDNHDGGYHLPLLQCVDAYFKVNYNPQVIEKIPSLKTFQKKIRSISQFFPLRPSLPLSLCRRIIFSPIWFGIKPGLRHNQPYDGYLSDAKSRLRDVKNYQSLEQIVAYRNIPKDIDIFYVTSFRHSSRHQAVMEGRYQVMEKLGCLPTVRSVMGFSSHKTLPGKYAKRFYPRLSQAQYLATLARAKIVIYTQGMEGCISSKFSLAMALGIVAVGEPLANNPQLLTIYSHLQEQLGYTNADELVEHAINLVAHPEKTRELSILNAAMFDHFLAPRPTAQYILHTLYEL